jgi:hypothetical protein
MRIVADLCGGFNRSMQHTRIYLFVRPGELRQATWLQFELDKGEWRDLVTKTKAEHLVPLAMQAIAK